MVTGRSSVNLTTAALATSGLSRPHPTATIPTSARRQSASPAGAGAPTNDPLVAKAIARGRAIELADDHQLSVRDGVKRSTTRADPRIVGSHRSDRPRQRRGRPAVATAEAIGIATAAPTTDTPARATTRAVKDVLRMMPFPESGFTRQRLGPPSRRGRGRPVIRSTSARVTRVAAIARAAVTHALEVHAAA